MCLEGIGVQGLGVEGFGVRGLLRAVWTWTV